MEELEKLITFIQNEYKKINKKWFDNTNSLSINMKRKRIEDIAENSEFLNYVFEYRNFLSDHFSKMSQELKMIDANNTVSSRMKTQNSIQYKIQNYVKNHEDGKISIKKCLNDILGIRIILENEITYASIDQLLRRKFPDLKCIASNHGSYKATHIYFGNEDNRNFQWELQIWNKSQAKTNYASHEKYKQEYTKWENDNR